MFVLMNLLHGFNDLSPPPGFVVLETQSKGLPLNSRVLIHNSPIWGHCGTRSSLVSPGEAVQIS